MSQSLESSVALSLAALALSVGAAAWVCAGEAPPVRSAHQASRPILASAIGGAAVAAVYGRSSALEFRSIYEPLALASMAAR